MNTLLVASGVTKTYGEKELLQTVVDNVDLTIERGESVAIVGKSGSGKSTLMHILSGLDNEYTGKVVLDGEVLSQMKDAQLDELRNKHIGFIFQTFYVQANNTVLDNVTLPLSISGLSVSEQNQKALEALKAVGLEDKAYQKAKHLSGGQRQRVCIARALVTEPSIIFADEPTGNLDSHTAETVQNLIFGLNKKGVTLVIVTHDRDLASKCSRTVEIKDGRIE